MRQDYELRAYIVYNLGDALEELSRIVEAMHLEAEVDEEEFASRMAHVYKHLNLAWNMRDARGDEVGRATSEQMEKWSQFPDDLKP